MKLPVPALKVTWPLWNTEPVVRTFLLLVIGLILALAGTLYTIYHDLPPQIPLYYSKATGRDQLAEVQDVINLSAIIVFIVLVDLGLATYLTKDYPLLRNFLLTISALCLILWIVSLIQISRLVA